MNRISHYKQRCWLAIIAISILAGCLAHQPTERAAVVIFNDTPQLLEYQLQLSNKWTHPVRIETKQFDYVFEYEQADRNEGLPLQITGIKLKAPKCKVMLGRKNIEKQFARDPEGRNTWDMHVSDELLNHLGCK